MLTKKVEYHKMNLQKTDRYKNKGGKDMRKVLKIDGMGCEHCVKSVKEALSTLEGLSLLEVKIGEATVEMAEDYDMKKIQEALDDAGYDLL